jgi:hypothetical protein
MHDSIDLGCLLGIDCLLDPFKTLGATANKIDHISGQAAVGSLCRRVSCKPDHGCNHAMKGKAKQALR